MPATVESVRATLKEIDEIVKRRRPLNGPRIPEQDPRKKARKAQRAARKKNRR